jgi:pyruvate/2-oxoglutarate dehydrogenase complex dihydrolipoamide acyltransferase (E2) component
MRKMTTRRKLAIASWDNCSEASIYGKMTLDMSKTLPYIEEQREKTGEKITITHIVGKAVGMALKAAPGLNGRILWGKYIPFDEVSICFLVALEDGGDLAKVKVENIDKKSLREVASELRSGSKRLRKGEDDEFEKSKPLLKLLPTWIIRRLVWLTGWLTGSLGISVPALGLERFPFGAGVITSVGMLGLDEGYAPFTPFCRNPILITIGAIKDRPCVEDGHVVAKPQLTMTATLDHRYIDGFEVAKLTKVAKKCIEEPWSMEGEEQDP